MRVTILFILIIILFAQAVSAQDVSSFTDKIIGFPSKFLQKLQKKSDDLEDNIVSQSDKYLKKLAKTEKKLKRKLLKVDSSAANKIFGNPQQQYAALITKIKSKADYLHDKGVPDLLFLDTLKTSLSFLAQQKDILDKLGTKQGEVQNVLSSLNGLDSKLIEAEEVEEFMHNRKEYLNQQLNKFGFGKQLAKYNKQAYYFGQQIAAYKDILNDPEKIEEQAMEALRKIPAFQKYMTKYSEMVSLLQSQDNLKSLDELKGLQTKQDVQQSVSQNLGSSGIDVQQLIQNNIQMAGMKLSSLKESMNLAGKIGNDEDIPTFKVNTEKAKTFWKKLEFGTNLQTQKSGNYFPTTTDIGLSIGYKISQNSVIGLGTSYKIGFGKDIENIKFSTEGMSLRSFVDIKLKASFYISGGFEYNYQQYSLNDTPILISNPAKWNQSGLLGVSKIISLQSKFFKKTRVQLLWDFLSYQQIPRTEQLKFRIGYNF